MAKRKAFITGITGQDGSYLAEILLEKGYEVYGMIRRSSSFNTARIDHIFGDLELVFGDLGDGSSLNQLIKRIRPDEVYNLGAQSHVRVSFDIPEYTADATGMGTLRLLDAIREEGVKCRFYEAARARCSARLRRRPRPRRRRSIRVARTASRRSSATGSPATTARLTGCTRSTGSSSTTSRRGAARPSSRARSRAPSARILRGEQDELLLGNLEAKRDWGYARDYMEGAWRMLQADEPDDYVLATGETHSVREFLDEAFGYAGLDWNEYVEDRRALLPAGRGRRPARRRVEGEGEARLGADASASRSSCG